MKPKSIDILGVRIDVLTIRELNEIIINTATQKNPRPLVVFKPYVEFLSLASRNENIQKLLNQSDINAADSIALQWAASYLYAAPQGKHNFFSTLHSLTVRLQRPAWRNQVIPERMAGVDQTLPLLHRATEKKLRIAIVGGPQDSAKVKKELLRRFSGIKLEVWSGYFSSAEEDKLVKTIAEFEADILFCAMGFPKQERFIINHKNSLNAKVLIGEGGSFDYDQLGGQIKRAPSWMRHIGLEWLWRLLLQPRRIKRQLAIPLFISKVRKQRSIQK